MLKKTPFLLVLGLMLFLQNCKKETPDPPASTADVVAPVITIAVSNPYTQYLPNVAGTGTFVVPAATATDNVDGDLTPAIVVTGAVNPNLAGTYSFTYTVSDAAGNTATQVLTVYITSNMAYLAGQYVNATDTCQSTPTSIFNATVIASTTVSNDIVINNFGAFGLSININATVSGSTITVPSAQNLGSGASIVNASGFVISSSSPVKFKINFTWTDGINTETCRSWYTKQ